MFPETKLMSMEINELFIVLFDEIPLLVHFHGGRTRVLGGACGREKRGAGSLVCLTCLFSFQPGERHSSHCRDSSFSCSVFFDSCPLAFFFGRRDGVGSGAGNDL